MKVKFMNFKEMAITQNTGMCSYLTIAWAVPYETNKLLKTFIPIELIFVPFIPI